MELVALAGLAALILVKEAGLPVPIPGDLLVIGAGVATAGDLTGALVALAAVLLAGYIGGSVQFLVVRGTLRRAVVAMLTRFGIPEARIESLASRLRSRGARGVAVARVTPGVRVPAIAASGLAALPLSAFVGGLLVGNTIFVSGHFALGFLVGTPAVAFIERSGPLILVVGVIALAVLGGIGWLVLRRRRQTAVQSEREGFNAWADAACPACLVLAIARPDERLT
jgi:membrane protein DedA with SNARE-associated domain